MGVAILVMVLVVLIVRVSMHQADMLHYRQELWVMLVLALVFFGVLSARLDLASKFVK